MAYWYVINYVNINIATFFAIWAQLMSSEGYKNWKLLSFLSHVHVIYFLCSSSRNNWLVKDMANDLNFYLNLLKGSYASSLELSPLYFIYLFL